MSGALPLVLDLAQAARQDTRVHGQLEISSMPRLLAVLASGDGEASVDLHSKLDPGGQRIISGRIDARVSLSCQRCLEPMIFEAHAEPLLAWVKSEDEAAALPEEYEPLLAPDGRVVLADLVADELLLALPLAPRHETSDACGRLAKACVRYEEVDCSEESSALSDEYCWVRLAESALIC